MNRLPAVPPQKMTLRRFVRVTLDNFRQLIQTIATPTTSLPMPNLTISPDDRETDTFGGDTLGADSRVQAQATALGETRPRDLESTWDGSDLEPIGMPATTPGADIRDTGAADTSTADTDSADTDSADTNTAEAGAAGGQIAEMEPADSYQTYVLNDTPVADPVADPVAVEAEGGGSAGTEIVGPTPTGAFTLSAALESLLFVADEAAEPAQLARALGLTVEEVEAQLLALDTAYREGGRGLRLQTRNGRYQLVTAPEAANLIETFLNLDTSARLSAPALETLAVVAYRQPVTRAQIEAVRGVDCSGVLRSLLQRGLLEEVGRLDAPGRPVLYGVTDLFMHHFGLTALHELPPLDNAELQRMEEALEQQGA